MAFLIPSLKGGGAERSMLLLARGLLSQGHPIDLVLARAQGSLETALPRGARIFRLKRASTLGGRLAVLAADPGGAGVAARPMLLPRKSPWALRYLPPLANYLRRETPDILVAGVPFFNLIALWAKRRAEVRTQIVVTERSTLSCNIAARQKQWRRRYLAPLLARVYPWAAARIAVSKGVAVDLAQTTGLALSSIQTIYNPVVTPELLNQERLTPDHPWFQAGAPPVVLAAGLFVEAKDFPTLLRAFALLRQQQEARLMILGEGKPKRREALEALVDKLGLKAHVALPGWVSNPQDYLAGASVFALSSAWEGLPGVLIQALAAGCPVVSTDCPSGPREILDNGTYGRLVPVGNAAALSEALLKTLHEPKHPQRLRVRSTAFSLTRALKHYTALIESLVPGQTYQDRPALPGQRGTS